MRQEIFGNTRDNNKGFTLIELLVALAVLVMAAAVFIPALTFVTKSYRSNYTKMTAGNIAVSVLEEIRAMPYDDIGTYGGNPSGAIPQTSSITVGNTVFRVNTRISWNSAKSTSTGTESDIALKGIKVTVSAPGVFSGVVEELGEINSIASRESEEAFVKNGHIRVHVKDSEDAVFAENPIHINLVSIPPTPSLNQSMNTDTAGNVLFGILDAGKYMVRARLSEGNVAGPGQKVEDGWIVLEDVEANDYQTSEAIIYMDKESNFSKLSVKLVKEGDEDGEPIISEGVMNLNWKSLDQDINVIANKSFTTADFVDGELPQSFFGPLWKTGTYNLSIRGVSGYANYDMGLSSSAKPLQPNGTEWDGTMQLNQLLKLRVPMMEGLSSANVYKEDTKADFEDAAYIINLLATDEGNGQLILDGSSTETNLTSFVETGGISASSASKNHQAEHISDGNNNTYWQAGNNSLPQWIAWDFGSNVKIRRVEILASQYGGGGGSRWSNVPKDFMLQCSFDEVNWTEVHGNSTLTNRTSGFQSFNASNPQSARYFRLYITDRHDRNAYVAVNEVRLYGVKGYANEGTRISKGKLLDNRPEFASAPQMRISWEDSTDADTSISVCTALTDSNTRPAESAFAEAVNGGCISNIARGSDIRGKYLWVMQKLETNDIEKTPSLDWLSIDY